tara:strand:+ start:819 stop:1670 length:852 start_codon:yes stop_codon:yes gene_type:complete
MKNLKMFCLCLNDHHLDNLKEINYIPVGLGKGLFKDEWLKDNTGENISEKNSYYGEYTFYYWIWKNYLNFKQEDKLGNLWIGFSGYRYHWADNNQTKSDELNRIVNKDNFSKYILRNAKPEWENYDVVLGEKINVDGWKFSKILKKGYKKLIKNPFAFKKENQNIKLHFDVFHGDGILDKAIDLLDNENRQDFDNFVKNEKSFNRENLFICKSPKLMNNYFNSVFDWLYKCEKLFGFDLKGYAKTRIYAFLAERYISYWFQKNAKVLEWPLFFFDTNKNRVKL